MRDERGATAIEYGLIAALICTGIIVLVASIGGKNTASYEAVADAVDGAI